MSSPAPIIFAGTPEFAAVSLRALIAAGFAPRLVLTQPDRPSGRGRKLAASPVKLCAEEHGIEVYQPQSLRSAEAQAPLKALPHALLIVAAYGLLLPKAVLDMPSVAPVNVHASLLPRWRGASPIQAAILAGDNSTGIALMKMDEGLDTGPVFATREIPISGDTAESLHDKLADLGATLLLEHLPALLAGDALYSEQATDGVTYAGRIKKTDAKICWSDAATSIERQVRAYFPWPVSYTELNGQGLRVFAASVSDMGSSASNPGEILRADAEGIVVATGDGGLRLESVQLAGKRRVSAADFANQRQLQGLRLG